jgi:hypothetical protein
MVHDQIHVLKVQVKQVQLIQAVAAEAVKQILLLHQTDLTVVVAQVVQAL